MKKLNLLGYACGLGAGDAGCADGPVALAQKLAFEEIFYPDLNNINQYADKYAAIAEINQHLAEKIYFYMQNAQSWAVISGDHSSAIGVWSGVAKACREKGDIGLIWVDAHLDSHTPETTESGNIHGMPVAALLGYGDARLTHIADDSPKIKPENLCIIGARSFETGEKALLEKLNIRVFYMQEVEARGFEAVWFDAHAHVSANTVGYGVSIDLDSIDPQEAPGVGSPEKNGLHAEDLRAALKKHVAHDEKFLGLEIAEFNPHRDKNKITENLIMRLLDGFEEK